MKNTMSEGVKRLFSEIPENYDLINRIITFGRDRVWRNRMASRAAATGGERWIDVCTGTGEMAFNLLLQAPEGVRIYASDFSAPMLQIARSKTNSARIQFVEAEARALPFPDNTFDLVTLSFATRNINTTELHLLQCLREFNRVLKPGTCFFNLETTQPMSAFVRFFFHLYVKSFVKIAGILLSSSPSAYRYLSSTIPRFYSAEVFSNLLLRAGFSDVQFERMFMGVVAIHKAIK